jgi:hypothetical protein
MSLILKNQRVYDFYDKHKEFDFEKMNILLVDLLENFKESLNPSLDNNFANKLTQQMNELKIQLLQKQQEQQIDHYKQLTDFKHQYLEEIKNVIHYNHTDKVQPILSQQIILFQEKINEWQTNNQTVTFHKQCEEMRAILQQDFDRFSEKSVQKETMQEYIRTLEQSLSSVLNSSESRLQEGFRDQNRRLELLSTSTTNQEQINTHVQELLRKMDNSSSKGKVSETILGHVINGLFPMGEIKAVGTIKETGDILLEREGLPTILFENKNYDRNVGHEEVQKFLRDIEVQKCCGILLAQNYGIANKKNYEIHIYQGQVCLYLHSVQYAPEKIKAAVDIIDHLSQYINKNELESEDIVIDFSFMEQLNKEYQQFAQSKLTQIKTIKDYSQKMLSQIEEMKFPNLEQWLGKHFSQSLATKEHQCQYCGFEAKTNGGLVSHLRACKKKPSCEPTGPPKPVKNIQVVQSKNPFD